MVIWYFELSNFDAIPAIASTDFFINHPLCFLVSLRRIPHSEQCLIYFRTTALWGIRFAGTIFYWFPEGVNNPKCWLWMRWWWAWPLHCAVPVDSGCLSIPLELGLRWTTCTYMALGLTWNRKQLMSYSTHSNFWRFIYSRSLRDENPPAPSVMDLGSLRSSSCFRLVFPVLGLYGAYLVNQLVWGHRVDLCSLSRGEMELQHVCSKNKYGGNISHL